MSEIPPLTIDPDAPADPVYVLELAEALAEIVRALNRLTLHHEALHYPSEAAGLIQHIATAASRLPQVTAQTGSWLQRERPGAEAAEVLTLLRRAGDDAMRLRRDLAEAAEIMAGMEAAGDDGSDEGKAADGEG